MGARGKKRQKSSATAMVSPVSTKDVERAFDAYCDEIEASLAVTQNGEEEGLEIRGEFVRLQPEEVALLRTTEQLTDTLVTNLALSAATRAASLFVLLRSLDPDRPTDAMLAVAAEMPLPDDGHAFGKTGFLKRLAKQARG